MLLKGLGFFVGLDIIFLMIGCGFFILLLVKMFFVLFWMVFWVDLWVVVFWFDGVFLLDVVFLELRFDFLVFDFDGLFMLFLFVFFVVFLYLVVDGVVVCCFFVEDDVSGLEVVVGLVSLFGRFVGLFLFGFDKVEDFRGLDFVGDLGVVVLIGFVMFFL